MKYITLEIGNEEVTVTEEILVEDFVDMVTLKEGMMLVEESPLLPQLKEMGENITEKTLSELGIKFIRKFNITDVDSGRFNEYEFELDEGLYVQEFGGDQYLFRLSFNQTKKTWEVYAAFYDDYDLGEQLTYLFDEDELLGLLAAQEQEKGQLEDGTAMYLEFELEQQQNEY